ncbi:MAG TPA: apolipoprotein N-acyltransferase [Candidatus Latescibacteria bacterium]|nr:apolipoprotein N-acyltransferase [Candidatus Latescibacterota bacterium]
MSRQSLILSAISGALLALAFPPLKLGFLAYVALVPFLLALHPVSRSNGRRYSYREVLWVGFVTGLVFNAGTVYWISWPTVPGGIFSVFFLSIFFILFAVTLHLLISICGDKAVYLTPFLWTTIEYLRSFGELAFPWTLLGNTQAGYTRVIQIASITGVYGVSFWVAAINLLVFQLTRGITGINGRKKKGPGEDIEWEPSRLSTALLLVSLLLLLFLPFLYGNTVIPREGISQTREGSISDSKKIDIALIQPNIPVDVKWGPEGIVISFNLLKQMTLKASSYKPDLIVWPETAAPFYLLRQSVYYRALRALSDSIRIPILAGAQDWRDGNAYNSAFLFRPGFNLIQNYDKIHLVPGSERMPFVDVIPFLQKITFRGGYFTPGKRFTVFQHPKGDFSVLICFESIFPDLVREFVLRGADFLINITNDGWFGRTSGPYQHAQIAIFRAVENRIPIARAANTGVSMFIDPYGRVSNRTGIFQRAIVLGSLPLGHERTFFTRHGNLFAKTCVGITIGLFLALWLRKSTAPDFEPKSGKLNTEKH